MIKVIAKNGDLELWEHETMGYCVAKRVRFPSGTTSHWQAISKWYLYKKYAVDIYNNGGIKK